MHPILFKIGNFPIGSYWAFMALGFIMGGIIVYLETKNKNLNPHKAKILILITIISAFVGSRLGYVFLNFSSYQDNLIKILQFWKGGFSWQGGFLAAFLIVLLILRNDKEKIGKWLDAGILGILIGHSIGRIGCFLNGCCYGITTNVPWAIKNLSLNDGLLRHPTQLYESLAYLLIFFFFLAYSQKTKLKNGSLFFIGTTLHSLTRFIIEYLRFNTDFVYHGKIWYATLTYAQLAALIIIIISLFILFKINYKKKKIDAFYNN